MRDSELLFVGDIAEGRLKRWVIEDRVVPEPAVADGFLPDLAFYCFLARKQHRRPTIGAAGAVNESESADVSCCPGTCVCGQFAVQVPELVGICRSGIARALHAWPAVQCVDRQA